MAKEEKENDGKKGKESKASKLLVGFVIGSAIGSVVGATLSDKDNRDLVKRKTLETWEKSKLLLGEVVARKQRKRETFWHKLNRIFARKKDRKK